MRNSEVLEMLQEQDLPEHYRMVSEACGIETARQLIKELGGLTFSIPKANSIKPLVERFIRENENATIKRIARELDMNEKAVAKIVRRMQSA